MGHASGAETRDEEWASCSIRIPRSLMDQIEARCKVSKRSKNKEIQLLLERQIDAEVKRDQELVAKMAAMNLAPQTHQS